MTGKYLPTCSLADVLGSIRPVHDGHARLQTQLAALVQARHVFLFRSARNALRALLQALGDTGVAVVPAYNCIAVPEAVGWAGWKIAFADVAPGHVNMSRQTLETALPNDARAVLLTHQFGIPSDVDDIVELCRKRGLFVIEDAAAALGARYKGRPAGSFGDAAIVSFHLTKVLNAGRAGALLTNDDALAKRVASAHQARLNVLQSARDFCMAVAWWMAMQPVCYAPLRMGRQLFVRDALYEVVSPTLRPPANGQMICSAYVARLAARQMERLPDNIAARRRLAEVYSNELAGVAGVRLCPVDPEAEPAWIQFPIFVERKEACYQFMLKRGVDLNWTFRYSCAESYGVHTAPNAAKAARTVLGLPTYPGLSLEAARRICDLLRSLLKE